MTDPAADVTRAAVVILAPDLGLDLLVQVGAALHRNRGGWRPTQYNPLAIISLGTWSASLIVFVAQLAWANGGPTAGNGAGMTSDGRSPISPGRVRWRGRGGGDLDDLAVGWGCA